MVLSSMDIDIKLLAVHTIADHSVKLSLQPWLQPKVSRPSILPCLLQNEVYLTLAVVAFMEFER